MLRIDLGNFIRILLLVFLSTVAQAGISQNLIEIRSNDIDHELLKIIKMYIKKHSDCKSFLIVSDSDFNYDWPTCLHFASFLTIGPFLNNVINEQDKSDCTFEETVENDVRNGVSPIVRYPASYFKIDNKIIYIQSSLDKIFENNKSEIKFDRNAENPISTYLDEADIIKVIYNVYPTYKINDHKYNRNFKTIRIYWIPPVIKQ